MAIWWMTVALPIAWTACVPLLLFPLLRPFEGGLGANATAAVLPYLDPYLFLFFGGMCIAAAMQQWGLHKRIALRILAAVGTEPKRLLLGVLLATAFISMWISNTATATMMVPIGMALLAQLESRSGGRRLALYGMALMLAIAYGANLGGIGTKIGTAPNSLLAGFLAREAGVDLGFLSFAVVGTGFVVLLLPVAWIVLWLLGRRDAPREDVGAAVLRDELAKLGPASRGERVVLAVFLSAAALWIVGAPITSFLQPRVTAFALRSAHVEASIALLAALGLAVARIEGRAVLELRSLGLVPWSALLLLGGGFSMASGVQGSGLADRMAEGMGAIRELDLLPQLLVACLLTVTLSAVASNTATIAVMLNVLWGAVPREHAPAVLFAATIASSCDFALPAGTPPNAIVFGSGYVSIPRMVRYGAGMDLVSALVAAAWCALAVRWIV
jgi:sodium-dependent dicarboxylate transporter 2/3/5